MVEFSRTTNNQFFTIHVIFLRDFNVMNVSNIMQNSKIEVGVGLKVSTSVSKSFSSISKTPTIISYGKWNHVDYFCCLLKLRTFAEYVFQEVEYGPEISACTLSNLALDNPVEKLVKISGAHQQKIFQKVSKKLNFMSSKFDNSPIFGKFCTFFQYWNFHSKMASNYWRN